MKFVDLQNRDIGTVDASKSEWSRNPGDQAIDENGVVDILLEVTGGDRNSENFKILYLRFVKGERVNVIAKRFGIKPNTVGQRIKYHVKKVRERYKYELMEVIDER